MLQRINGIGERYGWGVVVAASPFVNAIAVVTAGLGCFLLCWFFSMFDVYPAPPADTGNPISWVLYLLIGACYGWFIWSQILFYFMIPLGLAWSLADLLKARASGDTDRIAGATAGLVLTVVPVILYFRAIGHPQTAFLNHWNWSLQELQSLWEVEAYHDCG